MSTAIFLKKSQSDEKKCQLNAVYGLLHRSHLENMVQSERYDLAKAQIDNWQMPSTSLPLELSIIPSRAVTSSKIFRSQGDFLAARERLEPRLSALAVHEQIHSQVLCQLVDACSDLGCHKMSIGLRSPAIIDWRRKSLGEKGLRRVLVSSIDVMLQQQQYRGAKSTVDEVCSMLEGLQTLDITDELFHIRVFLASARVSFLCSEFGQAIGGWKVALCQIQKSASFKSEGFTCAVAQLSISLAHIRMANLEQAAIPFDRGQKILVRVSHDYLLASRGTTR